MNARRLRPGIDRGALQAHGRERWFVSYADFVTLLFGFFVVLFACARTERVHLLSQSVERALHKPPPSSPPKPSELQPALDSLNLRLRAEIAAGQMEVRLEPRGLVVTLSAGAFFPSGGDRLEPSLYPSILKVADAVRALPNPIRLEGHTDSQPIHIRRFHDNWELSAARALAMLQLLNNEDGIARERLAIAGYADTVPSTTNGTEQGRARNRRVEIVILGSSG